MGDFPSSRRLDGAARFSLHLLLLPPGYYRGFWRSPPACGVLDGHGSLQQGKPERVVEASYHPIAWLGRTILHRTKHSATEAMADATASTNLENGQPGLK